MLDGIWGGGLRRETRDSRWRQGCAPAPSSCVGDDFVAALISGGDSRLAVDPRTGVNKYLCPPVPSPGLVCASSCTATPIAARGFGRAADSYQAIVGATSPRQREERLADHACEIEARLLRHFGVALLAEAGAAHGGDAQRRGVAGRADDGDLAVRVRDGNGRAARGGMPVVRWAAGIRRAVVRLRGEHRRDSAAAGAPRPEDEVNDAYAGAVAGAPGRPVVYVTHGTKTGLIAPTMLPRGVDVIVDACQARIEPDEVARYLRRHGWPVVITGSKFVGGPAFSGAVLFPRARLAAIRRQYRPAPVNSACAQPEGTLDSDLGTVLRWTAALDVIEAFEPRSAEMAALLRDRAAVVERALGSIPGLVPIDGLRARGSGWSALPSIFTFAVRDPADRRRLLSVAELRPFYERLARAGVLLGQPVSLGSFGGMRIAVGARDLVEKRDDDGLSRLFAVLEEVVTTTTGSLRQRWWGEVSLMPGAASSASEDTDAARARVASSCAIPKRIAQRRLRVRLRICGGRRAA